MSAKDKITHKPYRNWVRGALGLYFLQEGLHPFTNDIVRAEHAQILKNLTKCKSCDIEKIVPAHAGGKCIQKNNMKCNCKKKKATKQCATCGTIYDEIVNRHRFKDPNWTTDCSTWYKDHWQFAKCFLTTTAKESNKTAGATDASGLLSIIINGMFFESKLQCRIDPINHTDIFSQARIKRNEILHNATQELTDDEVTIYLESMKAVLEILSTDSAAQAAVKKLEEILKDELNITLSEEAKVNQVIQTEIEAIKVYRTLETQKEDLTSEMNAVKLNVEPKKQKLEDGHDDQKKKIESHEERLQILEKRVHKLEYIAKLKDTEENLQMRSNYLKHKRDLQKHLVDEYQKEDVKTSISPLMTQQNNINISDVYSSPRMVVEVKKKNDKNGSTTEAAKDRATNNKHIEIGDLFGTVKKRNRKIFIVGDVGTGKSSLCKMMMQHWCNSIKERRNTADSGVKDEEGVTQEKDNDTYGINQFDFLFYVPLRAVQEDTDEMPKGTDDIVDMIKGRLEKYKTLVDDIFTNDSERVLILADGLDELKQSKYRIPQWIPKSSQAGSSTILTTSRPSSRGILNMKSSDCDLKVTLLGLKDKISVQNMKEKYMNLIDKMSDVAAFNDALSNLPLKDIENAPMLLQQIIWLYCNGYGKGKSGIGKSRTSVYIHIFNAILGWEYERREYERHKDYPKLHSSSFKHLSLPESVANYPRCKENQNLLVLLGTIAHNVYIKGNYSSLVFGRHKLKQLGISDEDIDTIVQTGILTEVNCADPTFEKSQLSFIHTSYVEFFAALYICCSCSDSPSSNPFTILERLIAVTSVTEILRLENVLIMICGLDPRLTENVCDCIYKLTPSDENTDENMKRQIHDLTEDCLSEHNSVDQETVVKFKLRLRHLYKWNLYNRWLSMRFSDLVPTYVETCSLGCFDLSHEQCSSLEACLSQAVSLRTLEIDDFKCTKDECEGHTIDLTNHKELQSIKLSRNKMSVSGINHTCLQSYRISNCKLSHEQYSLLSSCLSQAVSLRTLEIYSFKCTKDECEGHTIDLTNHKELQSIKLSRNKMSVSGINHTCLQSYRISDCKLSHEQCSLLSSCLSQAVSLRTLEIDDFKCTKDECEGHTIDLTNHKELQSIKLSRYKMSVSGINHTCLQSYRISDCKLSHEQCSLLLSCLSQAILLRTLEIDDFKCTKDECEGHTIDLTNHKELQSIQLSRNKMSVSGINHTCLQSCIISDCKLSHEQCSLLSSCLSQVVSLRTLEIDDFKCTKDECEGHTIDLTNHREMQVLMLSRSRISFSGVNHTHLIEGCDGAEYHFPV
ncbi:uncharacterized protein LOC128553701 [Mercenaria mercenaria]|uniref:uncharacterized protein LOC128553701 n=1 Tax=Mercenaria mercenaria TaxID=6596 RepID=UPI00234EDB26|nr:uncharacterized protein LOC128553701 [Mercenaria mercenaria]